MDVLLQWSWYLLAYLLGALAAWLAVRAVVVPTSVEEALESMPGAREVGGP